MVKNEELKKESKVSIEEAEVVEGKPVSIASLSPKIKVDGKVVSSKKNVYFLDGEDEDDVFSSVINRLNTRYEQLLIDSKAITKSRFMGGVKHFKTTQPKILISKLRKQFDPRSDVGVITYSTYMREEDGNRSVIPVYKTINDKKVLYTAVLVMEKQVVETVKIGEKIRVEEILLS